MNIQRTRGDTYPDEITVTNRRTGVVVNLTGCTFKLTVNTLSNPPDNSTELYQLTGVIDTPSSGVVTFSPTALQADRVGNYYYDIEMVDSFSQTITLVTGAYNYVQDITK